MSTDRTNHPLSGDTVERVPERAYRHCYGGAWRDWRPDDSIEAAGIVELTNVHIGLPEPAVRSSAGTSWSHEEKRCSGIFNRAQDFTKSRQQVEHWFDCHTIGASRAVDGFLSGVATLMSAITGLLLILRTEADRQIIMEIRRFRHIAGDYLTSPATGNVSKKIERFTELMVKLLDNHHRGNIASGGVAWQR